MYNTRNAAAAELRKIIRGSFPLFVRIKFHKILICTQKRTVPEIKKMAEVSKEKTESSSTTSSTTTGFFSSTSSSSSSDEEVFAEDQKLYFPWKLHRLLDAADEKGIAGIVSWMPDGRSFKVHNKHAFEEEIMSHYFKSSKFKSFQRSLNLWGFHTAPSSAHHKQGECYHPFFLKGFPELCPRMQRTRIKGNGRRRCKKNATTQERKVGTTTAAAQAPGATPAAQDTTFSLVEPGTQSDLSLDVYQRQRLLDFLKGASSLGFSTSSSLCAPPRPRAPQHNASALLQALLIQKQTMNLVNLLTNATRGSQTSSSFY
jgi:hypothetical protein